jgi:uncharacterized protein DUF2800
VNEKKHSDIGASSAARWMNCSGSVALCEKAPPRESSEAADEGTAAHELLEACVLDASHARHFLGQKFNGFTVTGEMADAVQTAVDWAFRKREEIGGIIEVEQKFDLSELFPGLYGTNDINIFKRGKRLVVCDYKHGQTAVEVQENKQLLFYALGAARKHNFEFEDVEMVIVQPRCPHPAGPIRSWIVKKEYLVSWGTVLVEAARLTQSPGAPLYRGEWCRYCPAKGICPKQNEAVEKALDISTNNVIRLPEVTALTDLQMVKILEGKKLIEDFIDNVQRAALHRLKNGEKIEGLKLVAGRGARIWKNEDDAKTYLEEHLGDGAYTKKLLSVAQVEKVLPKKDIETLWVDIAGNETVAHTSDRRKEIQALEGTLKLSKKGAG